ncbi:chemotaxis protein CheW [Pelagerythrobacter marinus]|uniref:chemotaxis protein CheW n=1 Tax=Pelagerythrobacter marinus TaxID=538382 RepID=UPI0020370229|nr:chemotaxis protein CheW [Pelagerythrobacter marinus]USA39818.1 chemotaxis protein CheW [Pelagerythrobacter marinus]WPZ06051.1 chemotaxis protein CheW [Pelagerythrobacter marinus]
MDDLLLLTRIAGRPAAFRAVDVRSIIELGTITPVPRAPDFVAGITALRSRALTVIDARRILGARGGRDSADDRSPVVDIAGHSYALLVDKVADVVAGVGALSPVGPTLGPRWSACAQGMVETAAGPAIVIDVPALITGPQKAAA